MRRQEVRALKARGLPTCNARQCRALATGRLLLRLTAARGVAYLDAPLDFHLCDEHRADIPDADALLERVPGLWEFICKSVESSGTVPVREYTRVQWVDLPKPNAEMVRVH